MLDHHLKSLDLCYFEVTEAFNGLQDDNVWKRPAPGLLSIGELAGHIAYWEAVRFAGDSEDGGATRDLANCKIKSPLLDPQFGYFTETIQTVPTESHQALTAQQVEAELHQIHSEAIGCLKDRNPDLQSKPPYWQSTLDDFLRYMTFHVAYHTGQMYSARHLLGEIPPDN